MDKQVDPLSDLAAYFDQITRGLSAHIDGIATELRRPPPVNAERIEEAVLEVTNLTRSFFAFFQHLTVVQADEVARQRASGGAGVLPHDWQRFQTHAGLIRLAMNHWPKIRDLIREQVPSRRRKLYRRPARDDALLEAQADAGDALLKTLQGVLNPEDQSAAARERGCFGDIAYPVSLFLEHLHAAYRVLLAQARTDQTSFLDVGCGGGLKVLAAAMFFGHAVGLEYDEGYAARASHLLGRAGDSTGEIRRADALSFEGYEAFDVIYLYRPMSDDDAMIRLERRITEQAKPGAVLIAPYLGFNHRHADYKCPRIADSVYLARASKAEATRLRRRAEFIGPAVPTGSAGNVPKSLWDPILAASRANGFDLPAERPRLPA